METDIAFEVLKTRFDACMQELYGIGMDDVGMTDARLRMEFESGATPSHIAEEMGIKYDLIPQKSFA